MAARQGHRLGMRHEMHLLPAVRRREVERLLPAERGSLDDRRRPRGRRRPGARVEPGDDDARRRPHRVGDVRVHPDRVDLVELVGAEPGEDVGQAGRDPAARHDPAAGRRGRVVPFELLKGLRVVRPEVHEVDAGGDRGVGHRHVVAHVGGVEDDVRAGHRRRERCGVFHVHRHHAAGCAETVQQSLRGVRPDIADRHLVAGPLHEVRDRGRSHLAGPAQDEDPAHLVRLTSGSLRRRRSGPAGGHNGIPRHRSPASRRR